MQLIVSADLACPPSEVFAFRSFTFFAHRFCDYDVIALVQDWDHRDTYWRWFKEHYLFDNVQDLVKDDTNLNGKRFSSERITCENLASYLKSIGLNLASIKNKNADH